MFSETPNLAAAVHRGAMECGPRQVSKDALRRPVRPCKGNDMKRKLTAFDDTKLSDWLIDLIADSSEGFLRALAEAVITAAAEDYVIVRPALFGLKRKYQSKKSETQVSPLKY